MVKLFSLGNYERFINPNCISFHVWKVSHVRTTPARDSFPAEFQTPLGVRTMSKAKEISLGELDWYRRGVDEGIDATYEVTETPEVLAIRQQLENICKQLRECERERVKGAIFP